MCLHIENSSEFAVRVEDRDGPENLPPQWNHQRSSWLDGGFRV